MLKLKNITRNDNVIEADYFPEGELEVHGHVSVSVDTREIVGYKYVKQYETDEIKTYCSMAASGLRKIIKDAELPKERTVMWY